MFKRTNEPIPSNNVPVAFDSERALSIINDIAADVKAMRANQPEVLDVYQQFTVTLTNAVPFNFRSFMTPIYWLIVVNNIPGAPAAFTVDISQGEKIYPNDRTILNFTTAIPALKARLLAKQYNLTLLNNGAAPVTAMIIGTSNPHVDIVY